MEQGKKGERGRDGDSESEKIVVVSH